MPTGGEEKARRRRRRAMHTADGGGQRVSIEEDIIAQERDVLDTLLMDYVRERRILIDEDITPDMLRTVIIPLLSMDEDEDEAPIDIYLSTNGGEASTALAICEVIDRLRCPTVIHIIGCAYSGGLLIAAAGKNNPNVRKVAYPGTEFMYHRLSGTVEGTMTRMEVEYDRSRRMQKRLDAYILKSSDIGEKTLHRHRDADWFFGAEEALNMGIIDEILS